MSSPAAFYKREQDTHVGVLTLNRPDNRNSMTADLLDAFASALAEARGDVDLRCLIITGRGSCFSAGADFKAMLQREGKDGRPMLPHETSFEMYRPFMGVLEVEVPVVAALNGHAIGGGFGLSMFCDVRFAHAHSKYGANFTRLGLSSGMAISYLLPRLVGVSKAAELIFSARLFSGAEAAGMGLVSEALDTPEEVWERALALAETIASNAPIAVRLSKQALYRGLDWDVRGAALLESFGQAATVVTDDCKEGVAALLGKRDPQFSGT